MPRSYLDAVDYADDIVRRTHGGRGVGELAPAMTSKVIRFVAPFQVEVNNTYQHLKDQFKRPTGLKYLGLINTEIAIFVFNTLFESIIGDSPLGFDFIRALIDIILGFADDDEDYGGDDVWYRVSNEVLTGLPFVNIIGMFAGTEVMTDIFGDDNDYSRYGSTNMGVKGVINLVKSGIDLVQWASKNETPDFLKMFDSLATIIPPLGGKQLSRTVGGITTVAQKYASTRDASGNKTIQFATDGDMMEMIHAAAFGRWALPEASEYFGDKRLLPLMTGYYKRNTSSAGTPVSASDYKTVTDAGLTGKQYFGAREQVRKYSTNAGKRAEIMTTPYTPKQKAVLDSVLVASGEDIRVDGALVYMVGKDDNTGDVRKNEDGSVAWVLQADYSGNERFDLSQLGDTLYVKGLSAEKEGVAIPSFVDYAKQLKEIEPIKDADGNTTESAPSQFRDILMASSLTPDQKKVLDKYLIGSDKQADYSSSAMYELSTLGNGSKDWTYKAKNAAKAGISDTRYLSLAQEYEKTVKTDDTSKDDKFSEYVLKQALTPAQRFMAYETLTQSGEWKISGSNYTRTQTHEDGTTTTDQFRFDSGVTYKQNKNGEWTVYADWTSSSMYELSKAGDKAYRVGNELKEYGIDPAKFAKQYKAYNACEGEKDKDGKTIRGSVRDAKIEYLLSQGYTNQMAWYIYNLIEK